MTAPHDRLDRRVVLRLPFDHAAARAARVRLVAYLAEAQVPQHVIEDAALVVSELARNGVLHGRPDDHDELEVSWTLSERALVLSVFDSGGDSVPRIRKIDTYSPDGRGLAIVDSLSSSWSVDRQSGTRVTAELPLP